MFPVTGLIDDFDRGSLDANWTSVLGTLGISSNQLAATGAPAVGYYNAAQYGPDVELYAPISALPGVNNSYIDLGVRVSIPGDITTLDGYAVRFTQLTGGTDTIQLIRIDNGGLGQILATYNQEVGANDWFGIRAKGTALSAFYRPNAGAWALLGSANDANYGAAGYMSVTLLGSASRLGAFHGGNYAALPLHLRGQYIPHMRQIYGVH